MEKAIKKRLKVFLTSYKQEGRKGDYCWEIRAYDFEHAEEICRLIGHTLVGKKVRG